MDTDLLIRFCLAFGIYVSSIMGLAYFIAIKMMKKNQKQLDELIKEYNEYTGKCVK